MEFDYILSDESRNSKGYIILTKGIQLEAFENNPVALYNHNIDKVVGNWKGVEMNKENPDQLMGTLVFDMEDPESATIAKKVSKNLIKHISVGLELVDGYLDVIDDVETIVVTNCILKEASVTALPANSNAIKLTYKGQGINDYKEFISANKDLLINNTMDGSKMLELTGKVSTLELEAKDLNIKSDEATKENGELKASLELKDAEVLKLNDEVLELKGQLDKIEKDKEDLKFNDLLVDAIAEGKIKEDQKATFLSLSFDIAETIINGLESKVIAPELKLSDKVISPEGEAKLEDAKDYRWYEKNDPEALKLMYNEDRVAHDKLEKEFYG